MHAVAIRVPHDGYRNNALGATTDRGADETDRRHQDKAPRRQRCDAHHKRRDAAEQAQHEQLLKEAAVAILVEHASNGGHREDVILDVRGKAEVIHPGIVRARERGYVERELAKMGRAIASSAADHRCSEDTGCDEPCHLNENATPKMRKRIPARSLI